jgi:AMP deaminase
LTLNRIDRYTRAANASSNDLTMSNLQPAPKSQQPTQPGSPVQSMHAQASASAPAEAPHLSLPADAMSVPLLPAQQARLHPSAATDTAASPPTAAHGADGAAELTSRTSSMTINPSTSGAPPAAGADEDLGLTRSHSSVTLDGEPKIFPGVVSRRRRSSLRGSNLEEGEGLHSGYHGADAESVVEEDE